MGNKRRLIKQSSQLGLVIVHNVTFTYYSNICLASDYKGSRKVLYYS